MKRWQTTAAVAVLLVLPLLVFAVWFYGAKHAPVFDYAMVELRVRDVGTSKTPLLGLPGRLGTAQQPGSHPGPVGFYLLAPMYRLLGGSWWALRVSTVVFNAAAIVVALLLAHRIAGRAAVLGVGILLALLELGYGLLILTLPWNPYLPVLWFVVVLIATWSVACGDARGLPIFAVAASICAQTHISHIPLCGVLGVAAFSWVVGSALRSPAGSVTRADGMRASVIAALIVALLWLPPFLEQAARRPGNVSVLIQNFRASAEPNVGLRGATKLMLAHLDAWHLTAHAIIRPSILRDMWDPLSERAWVGAVALFAWALCVVWSATRRVPALTALHGVLGASIAIETLAMSRIVGPPWPYLTLWGWALGAALVVSVGATIAVALTRRFSRIARRGAAFEAAGLLAILASMILVSTHVDRAVSDVPRETSQLAALLPKTIAGIRQRAPAGTEGRYLVTWDDAFYGGGHGMGLVNELERSGLRAGAEPGNEYVLTPHRVIQPKDATARIHIATGAQPIARARHIPGAVQLAFSDPRSRAERSEYEDSRAILIAELRKRGRPESIAMVDQFVGLVNVGEADQWMHMITRRMLEIGGPAAVFVVPIHEKKRQKKTRRR